MVRAFLIALSFLMAAISDAAAEGAVAQGDVPGHQVYLHISLQRATRQEANQTALDGCRKKASNCTIIDQSRNACIAGARSTMGRWVLGHGATPQEAKTQAAKNAPRPTSSALRFRRRLAMPLLSLSRQRLQPR